MIKKIHIYDVDGVLVNANARYIDRHKHSQYDLRYWNHPDTMARVMEDKLLPMADRYIADIANPEIYVIVATARIWTHHTNDFFIKHLGLPNKIIARTNYKHISDVKLKCSALKKLFQLKQFKNLPKHFWDDSVKNLYAVSELGVYCYHIQD